MHVKGFLGLILILLVSLYSCQDKKETVRDFDSIQPKSKKTQKRIIPDFSATSALSETSSELSSSQSISFSTESTF